MILQLGLLHLNKRIVKDFPKHTTIEQELTKYRLLNIFYNLDAELAILSGMAEEERVMKQRSKKEYREWLTQREDGSLQKIPTRAGAE